ncbi:unnamed protein product [Prunus armeniaca]
MEASPPQHQNWAKGPPSWPKRPPARDIKPGQAQGQVSPRLQPEFCDVMLTSAHDESNFFYCWRVNFMRQQ